MNRKTEITKYRKKIEERMKDGQSEKKGGDRKKE